VCLTNSKFEELLLEEPSKGQNELMPSLPSPKVNAKILPPIWWLVDFAFLTFKQTDLGSLIPQMNSKFSNFIIHNK